MSVAFLSQLVYPMIHTNQGAGDPATRVPEEQNAHSRCSVCPSPDQWPGPHTKLFPSSSAFQVTEVHASPLSCSPTPGATALIPFSFIYYLFLSHLSFQHEPWKPHQFHCPCLRSISSHHQGFCNSLVPHHKHFTASRKIGTATEQSPSTVFFIFQDWSGQLLLGRCSQAPQSEQGDFTPWHRFHTDFFGQPELAAFLNRKPFSSSSEKVYHIPR